MCFVLDKTERLQKRYRKKSIHIHFLFQKLHNWNSKQFPLYTLVGCRLNVIYQHQLNVEQKTYNGEMK